MTADQSSQTPTTVLGCPAKSNLHERIAARVDKGIEQEALVGIHQAAIVRSIALVVVAAYVFIDVPFPQAWLYVGFLVVFLITGMAHRFAAVALFPASWPSYVFILADSCILAYAFVAANPLGDDQWPVQMRLRNAGFGFFYVFLAATLPTFSPRKVLWSGISAVLAWTAVIAWIGTLPETVVGYGGAPFEQPGGNIAPGPFASPHFIYLGGLVRDMFVLLVVSGILATVVWRVRAMMLRQSETERQRANLARYFSPNMVEDLAGADQGFDTVRQHDAAVLFVDMVGFTGFAESHGPEEIFAVLREFHGLMAEQIFANDGTLDKYIGDAGWRPSACPGRARATPPTPWPARAPCWRRSTRGTSAVPPRASARSRRPSASIAGPS